VATGTKPGTKYATARPAVNVGARPLVPPAKELASSIFSHRNRLGRAWRQWAENELRKQSDPNTEVEARNELNKLMGVMRDHPNPALAVASAEPERPQTLEREE
jgi:hypothetical protein